MRIRHILEYGLASFGTAILPRLPRTAIVCGAHALGSAAYYFARHLRRTGRANLDIAFGESKSDEEKRIILIRSFQTFSLMLLDLFWFSRNQNDRITEYVHFRAEHDILFRENPLPAICVTAHAGNWELLGKALALRYGQFASIAAPLENEKLDRLFNRIRSETGQAIVKKTGAVRAMLKVLKNGGTIGFLLDQNTKPSDGGIFLDFFGLPVPVSTIGAMLALRTGARVFFGACLPDEEGHYRTTLPVSIETNTGNETNKTREIQEITERILRTIERFVTEAPEYWLWSYKRWKYTAPGKRRGDYPFYAKEMLPVDREAAAQTAAALAK